jgi:hypothetical protein
MAAEAGHTVIETPCWIQGCDTASDLERVHEWNAMLQMRHDADEADATTSATVAAHLTAICQRFSAARSSGSSSMAPNALSVSRDRS